MATIPLALPTSSTIGRDGQDAAARLINGYPEMHGAEGKSQYTIYGAPGLRRWDQSSYPASERGLLTRSDSELLAILGGSIVSFDVNGLGSTLTSIAGADRCILAGNLADPVQVAIVRPNVSWYVLTGGSLAETPDSDLPTPNSCDYLRGRTLYGIDDGRVYCSATDDAASISALAFDTANSSSDGLVRVFVNAGFAYLFGKRTLEIWQPDPSLAGQPFPFSPVQQDIDLGLMARHSVARFEKALMWVDHKGIVRYGRDGGAERVSSHAVERSIEGLSAAERAAMIGSIHSFHGHETFTLKGANFTWCLDLPLARQAGFAKAWYERRSYGLDRWRVNSAIDFAGGYILGAEDSGELYRLDPSAYDEDGEAHVLEVRCPHSHRFPNGMLVDAVQIDVVTGVGLGAGDDSDTAPAIMVDFSDDGGKTFRGERTARIGGQGQFSTTVRLNRWGRCTEKGRVWRIRASAKVLKAINSVSLEARRAG